ncbi:MAG TPA: DNA repair protein RecO [Chromatiales bacterium]|nr:DNA repair protein RecO [Thiotrichales bacterium]HIP67328.1 DNA repair protein RecO [Chromatiales bacterium]
MTQGAQQSNGFVLHSRRFRENSRILEVFTETAGRIAVVARVSRRKGGSSASVYQPFRKLSVHWRGRGELQNILSAEELEHFPLSSHASLCGLYCNELLLYLTSKFIPMPSIYSSYQETLKSLAEENIFEPALRRFEFVLLEELGFGLDLETDHLTGQLLVDAEQYYYHPAMGLSSKNPGQGSFIVPAEAIDAIRKQDFSRQSNAKAVKLILASTIDRLLDGRPLKSRQLFRDMVKINT